MKHADERNVSGHDLKDDKSVNNMSKSNNSIVTSKFCSNLYNMFQKFINLRICFHDCY